MIALKATKYLLIDYCLNKFFNNLSRNMLNKNPELINIVPNAGEHYSQIIVEYTIKKENTIEKETNKRREYSYTNCIINKCTVYENFVRLSFLAKTNKYGNLILPHTVTYYYPYKTSSKNTFKVTFIK